MKIVNVRHFLAESGLIGKLNWETGGLFVQNAVRRGLEASIQGQKFEAVWVDGGAYIGPEIISWLRRDHGPVINFNHDDPYGRRDRNHWLLYLRCVPVYDLVIVVRRENIEEAKAKGARNVQFAFRCADELAHRPIEMSDDIRRAWESEVAFVGTWMPERGPFMAALISAGIPLSIWGDRWDRAPEWPQIQSAWRGPNLAGNDYSYAIQAAKVNLGLLSIGNRDLHTTRSLEIPAMGGLLCAPRTSEHLELYQDGVEAVFWDDAEECAVHCRNLLSHDDQRQKIAEAGHARCLRNGHFNENLIRRALEIACP